MRWHELITCAATALLLATFPAHADLAKWDQARVTDLAKQLAKACNQWQKALMEQDPEQMGSGDAQAGLRIQNRSRALYEQSQTLADSLAKGEGYEKTKGFYRGLMEVVRDTEEDARQMMLDDPTMAAWQKVSGLVDQISPYYNPKADDAT